MIESELGDWRRTHYSNQLGSDLEESIVTIMGWVSTVRGHGNISFATINDKMGEIQIVAKKGSCPDNLIEDISKLKQHSCIGLVGKVKASEKSPTGVEIIPKEIRIFSTVEKIPPFDPHAKTVKNIDTRLEIRAIDLRRNVLQKIFQARNEVLKIIRHYLSEQSFIEINTPKMIAISIDFEEAYVDYNDIMKRIEEIIKQSISVVKKFSDNNSEVEFTIPDMPDTIPQYTYTELLDKIQATGAKSQWGDDLYPAQLKKIGVSGFYFIKDWPTGPKPFYVKVSKNDPKISESFDLMYGDLELSSGSTRIEKKSELQDRMKNKGMKIDAFGYHLNVFEYGVPPHAGCGIGLERLMMALTGTENIRDTTFYPRDVDRLTP